MLLVGAAAARIAHVALVRADCVATRISLAKLGARGRWCKLGTVSDVGLVAVARDVGEIELDVVGDEDHSRCPVLPFCPSTEVVGYEIERLRRTSWPPDQQCQRR
jgi:hypothetical protein